MAQFAMEDWQRVPLGELTLLQGRLRWRRRLQQLTTAVVAAVALGAVAVAVQAVTGNSSWNYSSTYQNQGTGAPSCGSGCNKGVEP